MERVQITGWILSPEERRLSRRDPNLLRAEALRQIDQYLELGYEIPKALAWAWEDTKVS